MLTHVHPKLPMRNKSITSQFYINLLGFKDIGVSDYAGYLIVKKDDIEIHFFEFTTLNPAENDGQVYIRTTTIDELYQQFIQTGVQIHPQGAIAIKPWGQKEFSILDPDLNLLTFGQAILV